jgi:outer membrane receptor protein involved in Fe transport
MHARAGARHGLIRPPLVRSGACACANAHATARRRAATERKDVSSEISLINFGIHCCKDMPRQAVHVFLMFDQPGVGRKARATIQEEEKSMRHTVLREAIRQVLVAPVEFARAPGSSARLTALTAFGLLSGPAFAQDAPQDQTSQQQLETITVTGSNIRRVDIETSNPVITIDRAQIEKSGKLTLGDLLQSLPAVTGGNVNPQVNNGGSYGGTSSIGLRGLGSQRTLVLINGQRFLSGDPNAIPQNMIERIEVLTDGASSVYGSDAIAGVVNFILRSDYQGAEFRADYGISDHDDGERKGYHFTFGQSSDKGSIMGGVDYNHQDQILSGHRKFGQHATDLTAGPNTAPYTFTGGSSSPGPGRVVVTGTPFADQFGCGQLAINPGANGQAVNSSNYHCFTNADKYNYAAVNLLLAPQERTSAFLNGNYKLTDNVQAYMTVMYSKTSASTQFAPAIIGTNAPGILVISQDSYYNPFGVQFGGDGGNTYQLRAVAAGPRRQNATVSYGQFNGGFKGAFDLGSQNWTWDAGFGYGHTSTIVQRFDYPNFNQINLDLGPSFLDPTTGVVTCGTPAAPITTGCTPFNIFALNNGDPGALAAIQAATAPGQNTFLGIEKYEHLDISGGLFDLPAGTVQLAGGVSHREEYVRAQADSLFNIDPATGGCVLGSACISGLQGGYTVREAYAELFIPVLKDIPFFHALNLTIGDRYSKYSSIGSTSNWKVALEWRPIEDVLLRGTVSKVFRAPTVANVFASPVASAPTLGSDPCDFAGSGANPNAGNAACHGVPTTGPFTNLSVLNNNQIGAIVTGSKFAGINLGPELGKSFDFGVVYDPHWLEGLSVSTDLWRVYLLNTIAPVGAQTVLDLCFNGVSMYCPFVNRFQSGPNQGQISSITQPTANLGRTDVSGVDVNLSYRLPEFSFGRFVASVNATYMKEFNVDLAPGSIGDSVLHLAGHFIPFFSGALSGCPGNTGVCTIPRWKAQSFLNWNLGSWDASWRMRYIGRFQMGNPNLDEQQSAYPGLPGGVIKYGAITYNDISFGYNIEALNTRLDFGVDNIADKQPPFFGYDSQTLNTGTDPSTFDQIGRYYHASITVKF